MRANAPPRRAMVFADMQIRPGVFAVIPGRFMKNDDRPFAPPGRYEKTTREKTHTHAYAFHTRGDINKNKEKTHISRGTKS